MAFTEEALKNYGARIVEPREVRLKPRTFQDLFAEIASELLIAEG